jgi:hypothetical protein
MYIPEESFCPDRMLNSWKILRAGLRLMIGKEDLLKGEGPVHFEINV